MENTHGIATKFHTAHSITVSYNQCELYGKNQSFHMEFHILFHVRFHIPYCFPSYIELGNMDGGYGR